MGHKCPAKCLSSQFFESLVDIPKDFSLDLFLLYIARSKILVLYDLMLFFLPVFMASQAGIPVLQLNGNFIKRTVEFSIKLKKGVIVGIYCP